jgi:glycosyltransferase involved in cell wall biosynthesis
VNGDAPAVELAGYLGAAAGVGEAARRYVWALRSAGVEVLERDVPLPGRDAAESDLPAGLRPSAEAVGFNLLCLNPEQMVPYLAGPEAPATAGRASIGLWSWEVDVVPPGWSAAAASVAEVWTYSRFAARLIGAATGTPVWGIAPPVVQAAHPVPLPFQLPTGFRVLVMFDYLSTLERKNPLGAIAAYRRAFRPEEGAVLVVKSVNGRHRPQREAELLEAIGGRPDIALIDRTVSGAERDALIAACDCCLSLHRSEGHGLPLAEAMALGKPVVATAYGGNVEFMSEANAYLVAWSPARVGEQVEHYPATASWAEPDLEHAARLLRAVREEPEEAQRRVRQAQIDVRALLAPEVVGAQMRGRLEHLQEAEFGRRGRRGVPRLIEKLRPVRRG